MKIADMQAVEAWPQEPGLLGACEQIARCSAICYNVKPKKGDAAVGFVERMISYNHGRTLEFATVVIDLKDFLEEPKLATFAKMMEDRNGEHKIVTNLRYLVEHLAELRFKTWREGLEKTTDNTAKTLYRLRPCIHYPLLSRAIADELRTHVTLSTLMQSTRYVRANKEGGITFVRPTLPEYKRRSRASAEAMESIYEHVEEVYAQLDESGEALEVARDILPLSAATEMVQCGFESDWQRLVRVRSSMKAHPDCRVLAAQIDRLMPEYEYPEL